MKKIVTRRLLPILLMAALLGFLDMPQVNQNKIIPGLNLSQKIHLGLDLQGGTQLDYKIDLRKVEVADQAAIIEGITEVINKRVNNLGVSEPNIYTSQIADEHHIVVELAGIKDIDEAKRLVGKTIQLEFKERQERLASDEKEKIRNYANSALEKIKENDNFTLVGNEEMQAFPGKTSFYDGKEFISEETLGNEDLKNVLSKLKNGELYNGLLEISEGFTETGQDKTGIYIIKRLDAAEEEVQKTTEKQTTVSHIVVSYTGAKGASGTVTRSQDEALERIKEVQQKLQNSGDFEALAKEYSDEPAAKSTGGKLIEPVKTLKDGEAPYYDPTFTAAALTLKVNQLSDVVETPFGYHLIRANDTEEASTKTVIEKSYKFQTLFYSTVPDGWRETGLTGEHFVRASVVADQFNNALVSIKFNDEGKKLFGEITGRNVGKPIAIFVGGELISAPNVNEKILGGDAQITGNFTYEEASTLARDLNTGAIPAPIILSGQYSIGASLGADALAKSIYAGILGLIILAMYMMLYYRLSGLIANLALLIYAILLFFLIKIAIPMTLSFIIALVIYSGLISMILKNEDSGGEKLISFLVASFVFFFLIFLLSSPIVLTLAGIAGVILSIGMAVDANVLIFERIKEEVNIGKPMKAAIEIGFERAWSSIRDSNYSSLITCSILLYFGTSIIKGFAINLAAGILVSMFTAITITRAFFDVMASTEKGRKWLEFGLKRKKEKRHFEIIKNSKVWFSISGALIGISIIATLAFGFNLGIDFTGGAMMEIKTASPATSEEIATIFANTHSELAEQNQEIVDFSSPLILPSEDGSFIIRTKDITNEQHDLLLAKLSEKFGQVEEPRFTVVGPTLGSSLKKKALIALFITAIMIVLYIAFAFRKIPKEISPWKFGFCAILALAHDVIITVGVFVLLGHFLNVEMDALFVTALLTIMGFSVHDTIVVFDRIRENLFIMKRNTEFDTVTNTALNETMARSLNTSISTLFTIAALFLFGAESVKYFVFALLMGVIVGTYSSIFTASPILCAWRRLNK
ncbi:MAG: protein translocase subunit SecF [Candidatus Peregrinibacteria bacterium]|nr:protein translocase subunit SecF [Candidatus Peregrinibacteria bacterium]MDZ4244875.1 protein translocase subunit SecF [Candidatus Gracilibacteria bacterium]